MGCINAPLQVVQSPEDIGTLRTYSLLCTMLLHLNVNAFLGMIIHVRASLFHLAAIPGIGHCQSGFLWPRYFLVASDDSPETTDSEDGDIMLAQLRRN